MPKHLLAALALLAPIAVSALPNEGFEAWPGGPDSLPYAWSTHGINHPGFHPVTRAGDHYTGTFSVKIENKIADGDTTTGFVETLRPGGKEGFGPAFPLDERVTKLTGFYKLAADGDSAQIYASLYKHGFANQYDPGLVGNGWVTLGSASIWKPFSLTFNYYDTGIDTTVPDSGFINISAYKWMDFTSQKRLSVVGNSALYVDELAFEKAPVAARGLEIARGLSLTLNANGGRLVARFETGARDRVDVTVYDLDGRVELSLFSGDLAAGSHAFTADLARLSCGKHLFVIASPSGYHAELFLKR